MSSSSQDSSGTSSAAVSPIKSNVPARNSSAAIFPRASVRTGSSVIPTDGSTEHCPTSTVVPHARLTDGSIPVREVDCDFELSSDQIYQNSRLLLDANQLITPIDGTSESTDVNASQSHRLKDSRIDLSVRGCGIDNVSKEVPVSFGNEVVDTSHSRRKVAISLLDNDLSCIESDVSSTGNDGSYRAPHSLQQSAKFLSQVSRPATRSVAARSATDNDLAVVSQKKSAFSTSTSSTKHIPKSTVTLPHTNCSFSSTFKRSKLPSFNDILYAAYRYECINISKTSTEPRSLALVQSLDWSGVYAEVACSMCPSDFTCEFPLVIFLSWKRIMK